MIRSTCLEREIQRFQKNDDPQNWYTTTRVERVHPDTTVRLMCCSFHRALTENGNYYMFNIYSFVSTTNKSQFVYLAVANAPGDTTRTRLNEKSGILSSSSGLSLSRTPARQQNSSASRVRTYAANIVQYDSTVQCEGCATYL